MVEPVLSQAPAGKIAPAFPDFFIVGAPKCGTTSLHAWLSRHAGLHMPVKEAGFFAQDILAYGGTLTQYLDLFSGAGGGQLIGEATPKYLFSPLGLRQIRRFNPAARIVVLLRPPLELMFSFYRQMLRQGEENQRTFDAAWQRVAARRRGQHLPRGCHSARLLDYPAWGRIGTRLADVYNVFPREQVKLCLLEDMRQQPRQVYRDVLAHLGLDDDGFVDFATVNRGWQIQHLWLHRAALKVKRTLYPDVTGAKRPLGGRGTGILRQMNHFNRSRQTAGTGMSAELQRELATAFLPEVEMVEQLSGRALTHWKGT